VFGEWQSLNAPEVVILSVLIFVVLTVLRGTRGEAMLKTLAALLAVTYIVVRGLATSDMFDGSRLTFVLDNILAASSIALVVIFQPELRRLLALKIGARFFAPPSLDAGVVEEVTKAAFELGKTRTGALIVLERDNALDQYFEDATILDAEVSTFLLQTIFFVVKDGKGAGKGTPLHDGAVIVREGRIAAARCYLTPPKDMPELDESQRQLGARHRAALGLSHEQDALVVVVSEERGSVSLAVGGKLEFDLDAKALKARLHELYRQREQKEEPTSPLEEVEGMATQPLDSAAEPRPVKGSTTRAVRR
jgi:diadenylate cyclase